jgi:hypothetical protein
MMASGSRQQKDVMHSFNKKRHYKARLSSLDIFIFVLRKYPKLPASKIKFLKNLSIRLLVMRGFFLRSAKLEASHTLDNAVSYEGLFLAKLEASNTLDNAVSYEGCLLAKLEASNTLDNAVSYEGCLLAKLEASNTLDNVVN